MYALGKNPKKAKELGEITDPVKFAFAVAKLETQLTVTSRKQVPPPEKKNPPLSSEPKKNWVELWNEQLFKPIPLREEEKR